MEESSGPDNEEKADLFTREAEPTSDLQQISTFQVREITPFNKSQYVDMKQPGGRWAPVFPYALCTGTAKEEKFLERMIALDIEKNLG